MTQATGQSLTEHRSSLAARAWRSSVHTAVREPTMTIGLALLAVLVLISVFAPFVITNEPTKINMDARLDAPSTSYWFGTDAFGRDVFSRTMSGGRISLLVAAAVAVLTMLFGATFGSLSGYFRKVDAVLMRVMDGLMAFPSLLLALLVLSTLGERPAPWEWLGPYWEPVLIVVTVGVVFMPSVARVMRSVTLKEKNLEFVMNARLRGESGTYIVFCEILPNAMTVLAVELSVRLSYSILIVSSLGFLGLGVQPPSPDWGLMISESRRFIGAAPWMTLAPAGAVASLVVGVNLLADGIRQASGLPRESG